MSGMEQVLEEQLLQAGSKLISPPSAIDELLSLLDQVENCLSRVEQSPSKSMSKALCPSMTALVREELLRHSNIDVRVAVASCISEITRITAPDAPYDDALMKEIFQMIVAAFENLFDMQSPSFSKRVSILETVAKVRSCVVMLDLECDALILDMFRHFINSLREAHSDNIFTAMETIMTLVLEESEEISSDILSFLLGCLKKDNPDVLPIACRLAEKVMSNCGAKLKTYLVDAVQSMGVALNDYSEVVTSLCQETSESLEHNDVNASEQHADERRLSISTLSVDPQEVAENPEQEAACPGDVDTALIKSPKSRLSNGTTRSGKEENLEDPHSPKKKPERSRRNNQSKSTIVATVTESDNSDPQKNIITEATPPDHSSKRTRARKSNSLKHSTEISDQFRERETVEPLNKKRGRSKEAENSAPHGPSGEETAVPSELENKGNLSSPTEINNETAGVASAALSQIIADTARPKRGRSGTKISAKKGDERPEADVPTSPLEAQGALLADEDKLLPSADADLTKESEVIKSSEAKPLKGSGKKVDDGIGHENEPLVEHQEVKHLARKGKTTTDKGVSGESNMKKVASSPKTAEKLETKEDKHPEGGPRTASKRKSLSGKEGTSTSDYPGENLIGSKIKVWWPKDKMFYEGIVDSFDPTVKKHKILYTDGDEELLFLKKERWEFVCDETGADEGAAADVTSPDTSTEGPSKKKVKMSSDSSNKMSKPKNSLKKGDSSTPKSKSDASKANSKREPSSTKTSSKPKPDATKTSSKPKPNATKTSSKPTDDTPKTSSKSRPDASKSDSKAKSDSSKTSSKPKSDTPKTGSKSELDTPRAASKSKLDSSEVRSKPKPDTPKTSSKSKNNAAKIGSKSKADTPKTSNKSKADAPRTGGKSKPDTSKIDEESKGDQPKSGSKSKASTPKGSSKSNMVGSSGKGKSGSEKAQESGSKSGKKRRRGVQG